MPVGIPRPMLLIRIAAVACLAVTVAGAQTPQSRPRGRALGIPFPGKTGPNNAITDVAGIAVGHVTLVQGDGVLVPGKGPIRTGVTAILPRPKGNWDPVFAATFNLNGNGDMTGINWIKESGFMEGPILLTGTHSVGTVRDAAIQWQLKNGRKLHLHLSHRRRDVRLPERRERRARESRARISGAGCRAHRTGAGRRRRRRHGHGLQRIQGRHRDGVADRERTRRPLHARCAGAVQLRRRPAHPRRADWSGNHRHAHVQRAREAWRRRVPCPPGGGGSTSDELESSHERRGSIIVIVATDAPLLPHQLERLGRRVSMGLGRLGSWAGNSSGDLFLAFSTANPGADAAGSTPTLKMLPNNLMDPFFRATIDATEEAVVNAMLAAETMTGVERPARVRLAWRSGRRRAEEVRTDEIGPTCLFPRLLVDASIIAM